MNSRFRPPNEYDRPPAHFPPPPNFSSPFNFSHFTQQAIRAGFMDPDMRRPDLRYLDFHQDLNGLREAMQRELEKERIRAEIIAEEMMRRRILEDEVRRELMMEREMALRFGSPGQRPLEPRLPLLANFEHRERFGVIGASPHREVGLAGAGTLPFQRDPWVAGNGNSSGLTLQEIKDNPVTKDKVIILAKPSGDLADLKRKAATPPGDAAVGMISGGFKKQKTKDEWSCALCHVSATSERTLNEHLQGRKHRARETAMVTRRTGFATSPSPKKDVATPGKRIKSCVIKDSPSSTKKYEKAESKGTQALKPTPGTDDTLLQEHENSVGEKGNVEAARKPASTKSMKKKKEIITGGNSVKVPKNQNTAISTKEDEKAESEETSAKKSTPAADDTSQQEKEFSLEKMENVETIGIQATVKPVLVQKPTSGSDDHSQEKENSVEKMENVEAAGKGKPAKVRPRRQYGFYCEVCKFGSFSQRVMNEHKAGKKHRARIKALKLNQTGKTNPGKISAGKNLGIEVKRESDSAAETHQEAVGEQVQEKRGSGEFKVVKTNDELFDGDCDVDTNPGEIPAENNMGIEVKRESDDAVETKQEAVGEQVQGKQGSGEFNVVKTDDELFDGDCDVDTKPGKASAEDNVGIEVKRKSDSAAEIKQEAAGEQVQGKQGSGAFNVVKTDDEMFDGDCDV